MFCTKCGTQLSDDAGFCHKCGSRVISQESVNKETVKSDLSISEQNDTSSALVSKNDIIIEAKNENKDDQDNPKTTTEGRNIYNRLKADSASCSKIKNIVINEGVIDSTTTIKGKFYKYHCFWRNHQKDFGISPTWLNMLICFVCIMIDGIFATLFFEDEYYLPLTICILIECILWFPFMIKGYREKKEITAYISKTLNCELRASKVGYIISGIINAVYIVLGIIALCISIEDMSYDESYYYDYEEEDTYYNYEVTTSAENNNDDIVSLIYNNENEGFSFMYPQNWTSDDVPENIVTIGDGSAFGYYRALMAVTKTYVNDYEIEAFFSASLIDFEQEYSYIDEYEKIEGVSLQDITLCGYPARKLIFEVTTSESNLILIQYFYYFNSEMYFINFASDEIYFDKYETIFDAIMESYDISTE